MPQSLQQKAVKGVSWNLAERFGNHGMRFVLAIFLARLLTPEDFGLIGMITVFFCGSRSLCAKRIWAGIYTKKRG